MARKKNSKIPKNLSKPGQVRKAIKRAAKSGGKVSRKEIKQISKASQGTVNAKKIAQFVKKQDVKGPSKVKKIAQTARGKNKGTNLKGIKNTTPLYNNLPKFDPKKAGNNIPKYVAAPGKGGKVAKGSAGGGPNKGKGKETSFGQTITPASYNKKKFNPGNIEQKVKSNWKELKKNYKGPTRLNIQSKDTGRLKKYKDKSSNSFNSKAYFKNIKDKIKARYTSKGGTRKSLDQKSNPNFDKIPEKYGKTLDNVRSSLSGIKKKSTADSVGSKLTKSYTPAPTQKATRKKRGLNILGISNSSITAS